MTQATLQDEYKTKIAPALSKELGKQNVMAIPRVEKIKISVGVGKIARKASNAMDDAKIKVISDNITTITGQKPTIHKAKKSISNFKTREGMPIGISVTLRGTRMYDFLSKLVNITLPRVRDFRGLSPKAFDGHGNYSLGIKDYTVFPEIKPEDIEITHGLEVTVVTTASDDTGGRALLTALGFPFKKAAQVQAEEKAEEKPKAPVRPEAAEKKEDNEKAKEAAEPAVDETKKNETKTEKEEPKPKK